MSQRAVEPKKKKNEQTKFNREWSMATTIFTLKFRTKNVFRSVDSDLTTHSMILVSIARRLVVVLKLQNSFPAGSFPRENWLHLFSFFSTALSFSFKFHRALNLHAFCEQTVY